MREYKICFICDEKNEVGLLECKSCGGDLSIIAPTTVEEEENVPEVSANETSTDVESAKDQISENKRVRTMVLQEARLVSRKDGYEIIIPFEGGVLGRESLGEEYLNDCMYVSSNHAKIFMKENRYFIIDENSTNGTLVNNRRLQRGMDLELNCGDSVILANIEFLFMC